jgi:hypothetical protein
VAHDLSGSVVMGLGTTADGADVTVVTGSDFSVDTPTTPSSTGAVTPAPPGTGTASAASAVLAPPTAPTQALAPFDPRSCTASGREGP